jgi:hypothetical protein
MSHSLRVKCWGADGAQVNAKGKGHRRLPTKFLLIHYLGKGTYILWSRIHEVNTDVSFMYISCFYGSYLQEDYHL